MRQKLHKFLLPPLNSMLVLKSFFSKIRLISTLRSGGKGLKFLSGSYRFCLGKKLHKNSEKKVKVRNIWKTLYLQLKTEPPWSHPLKTYAQMRKWGVNPNTYNCLQARLGGGEEFQSCIRTQKKFFWTTNSENFSFFCAKETITLPFIIVYRNF